MGRFIKIIYEETGKILDHLKKGQERIGNCKRCGRFSYLDRHHDITQSRGGTDTVDICRTCHSWIGEHIAQAEKEGFYTRGYKIKKKNNE